MAFKKKKTDKLVFSAGQGRLKKSIKTNTKNTKHKKIAYYKQNEGMIDEKIKTDRRADHTLRSQNKTEDLIDKPSEETLTN